NAKNVNYVRTPHFKNTPGTRHVADCPYASLKASGVDGAETDDGREEHFPSELLLTRRQYVRRPSSPAAAVADGQDAPVPSSSTVRAEHSGRESSPDKTSVFAHPVECFVSNFADKELLKRMPLK